MRPKPLHIVFAQCLGLLSAEMEHHWLMQDARAEATEAHRATLIALTDAATPVGLESRTMHIRLEAKFAHKALLARAAFNDDPDDALWAAAQAESAAARCVGIAVELVLRRDIHFVQGKSRHCPAIALKIAPLRENHPARTPPQSRMRFRPPAVADRLDPRRAGEGRAAARWKKAEAPLPVAPRNEIARGKT